MENVRQERRRRQGRRLLVDRDIDDEHHKVLRGDYLLVTMSYARCPIANTYQRPFVGLLVSCRALGVAPPM